MINTTDKRQMYHDIERHRNHDIMVGASDSTHHPNLVTIVCVTCKETLLSATYPGEFSDDEGKGAAAREKARITKHYPARRMIACPACAICGYLQNCRTCHGAGEVEY